MISFRIGSLVFLVLLNFISYPQIDPHKLDSLSRVINSSAKTHKKWQDSFTKIQDSIYQSTVVDRDSSQSKTNKQVEIKKRQKSILPLIIGVLICTGLIIGFAIKKKPKS